MIKKLLFLLILNVFFVNFTSSFYSLPKYSSKLNMAAVRNIYIYYYI